ncbi:MAG: hypothetical protein H7319_21735 [Spirosoma sp.]|nr:hypothetical protein [Spirosoma sp.]
MTPDRRLDQLEPLMADSLQKIDRLIEGQGKILDFAVNTNAEVQEIKQQLAGLSERTDQQFVDLSARTEQQLAGLSERTDQQFVDLSSRTEQHLAGLSERTDQQFVDLSARTEQQITDLAALTQKQIDELKTGQEALKVGQDLILQLLREKLG